MNAACGGIEHTDEPVISPASPHVNPRARACRRRACALPIDDESDADNQMHITCGGCRGRSSLHLSMPDLTK